MNLENFDKITHVKISQKRKNMFSFKKIFFRLFSCFSNDKLIFKLMKTTYLSNATEGRLTFEGVKYKEKTYQIQYLVTEVTENKECGVNDD